MEHANRRLTEAFQSLKTLGSELAPTFWVCVWLDLLALAPIFLFIPRYIDDNGRAVAGFTDWSWGGRPLADLLMPALDLGTPLALATPLFQLLAIAMLALAGAIVARIFGVRSRFWAAVATLPMVAQPYFLENLSYGFDAATMALALLLTVIAVAAFAVGKPSMLRSVVSGLVLLAALSLYQPCATAFFPLAVFAVTSVMAREDSRPGAYVLEVVRVILVFAAAMMAYKFTIASVPTASAYMAQHSSTIPLTLSLPLEVLGNVGAYWRGLFGDWSRTTLGPLAVAIGAASLLILGLRLVSSATARTSRILLSAATLLGTAAMVHGPALLLTDPHLMQSRTLVAVGVLLSVACLQLHRHALDLARPEGVRRYVAPGSNVLLALMAWSLIVVSYTYANAFRSQFEFEQSVMTRLAYDIEHSVTALRERDVETVVFVGRLPTSRILANSTSKFPYMGRHRLIPTLIANNWWWGHIVLGNYDTSGLKYRDLPLTRAQLQQLAEEGKARVLFVSRAYRGFLYDGTLVVEFPDSADGPG